MANLKKRADGRYLVQIYLGRDEEGKKTYKNIYADTPAKLREKEAKVRTLLGKGIDVKAQRDAFSTWAGAWLSIKEASRVCDKQLGNYRRAVDFWEKRLAGYEIGDVRADDIETGLLELVKGGYAERTVKFYRSTMRQIMERAVGRVIEINPERRVKLAMSGAAEEQRRALTKEEQGWIWDTPHRGQAVAVIMMLSGLRRGELAALTWGDVDLKARTIAVNKVVEYADDGTPSLRNYTKSHAGMRVVDIPKKLCEYMAGMERDNLLVIHTEAGGVMTHSAWVKLWSSYMRLLNVKYGAGIRKHQDKPGRPGPKTYEMTIPHITLHWLRHTFCTLMYLAGVDVMTASKQMGHADVATTLRIYTHLDDVYKRRSVGKLDRYLGGQSMVSQKDAK